MFYGINGAPGVGTGVTATNFPPFLDNDRGAMWIDGGRFLDKSSLDFSNPATPQIHRPGVILGKITSSGKYAATILGVSTAALTTGGTTITVSAAQASAIASRVGSSGTGTLTIAGPPASGGTVATNSLTFSAVNVTTGAITITATGTAYAIGSIIVAADGSQAPIALLDGPSYGITTLGVYGAVLDQQIPRLCGWR